MSSLFLKIFLWFWLTVVLIGATLVVTTLITRSEAAEEQEWRTKISFFLPYEATHVVEVYERGGKASLQAHVDTLQGNTFIRLYFFDGNGNELLGHNPPLEAANLVETATRDAPLVGRHSRGDEYAVQKVVGSSGQKYTMLVLIPRMLPVLALLKQLGIVALLRLFAVVLVAGIFCFLLARHITRPVIQLGEAASRIADGRLDTRVVKTIRWRRDEIGTLGLSFDRMAERIESLVDAQKGLLAVVSHELRSPLARLSVALGLLRQSTVEEKMEYLDRIELETEHLDKLIGQLLTLARIDGGADSSRKERIDLSNLIQEVAADGNFEAQGRSCTVKLDCLDSCVRVGAPENVRTAIENVVRNAIRYAKPSTDIEVSLRRRGTPPDSRAVIQVRDHGPGVPVGHLTKIFLPFYRVPSSDDSTINGAGLGLAITERVVRMHGGRVRAANAPGGGLVVELELPLNA